MPSLNIRALRPLSAVFGLLVLFFVATPLVYPAFAQLMGTNGPKSVAPTAKKLIPAVVNISTSQVSKGPKGMPLPDVPEGAPFEKFFDDFFEKNGEDPSVGRKVSSLGSGFVINGKEGLVVTNNHVILEADEIFVNFSDGSKLKVEKVLGRDTKTDLALLKVSPKEPLSEVRFGSSAKMEVGDWVMAIGNPFGLGGSVTVGIISAKERDINSGPYDDYLQTDAAINKGNSGGPLFNMDGEVIGVNTAIISPTGGSIGIGFAVPSDTALRVIEQLRLYGETRRGWLGVRIQSISEDIANSLKVPENSGALVALVEKGSPADKAGIEESDVIVTFDGKAVDSMRALPRIVAQTAIGSTVPVEVVRDGERKTLQVEVGRLNEGSEGDAPAAPAAPSGKSDGDEKDETDDRGQQQGLPGVTVGALDDAARQQNGIAADVAGVVVTAVEDGSAAARKNIKAGDVILEVANTPVSDVASYEKAIAAARARTGGSRPILVGLKSDGPTGIRMVAVPVR